MKIVHLFTKVPLIKIVCKESYKEILRFNDGFNVSWCSGVIMCLDLGDPRAQTQWEARSDNKTETYRFYGQNIVRYFPKGQTVAFLGLYI